MQLAVERNRFADVTPVSFESGAEVVNVDTAQFCHQPVCYPGRNAPYPEIVDAHLTPTADDVITGRDLFEKHWNVGGIVLQIAIHRNDVFAAGMVKACGEPGGLAEVAAQLDHGNPAVDSRDFAQHGEGMVTGAIIHQHYFERLASSFHYRFQAVVKVGDVLLFVVQGDYDGIFRHSFFIISCKSLCTFRNYAYRNLWVTGRGRLDALGTFKKPVET